MHDSSDKDEIVGDLDHHERNAGVNCMRQQEQRHSTIICNGAIFKGQWRYLWNYKVIKQIFHNTPQYTVSQIE